MPDREMNELRKIYGDEYPDAVTILGMRLPLTREGRFVRHYYSEEQRHGSMVSRFEDGSATITLGELRAQWPTWSGKDKLEFLSATQGLQGRDDYPDMLRFLMGQDDGHSWSAVALQVASWLPQSEAFDLLTRALARTDLHSANITQGIALTRHPEAVAVLGAHFHALWGHPGLWDDDPFLNWHAFDAICCIQHLVQLGVSPDEYRDQARALSAHACAGARESCANFLSPYYDWLPKSNLGNLAP